MPRWVYHVIIWGCKVALRFTGWLKRRIDTADPVPAEPTIVGDDSAFERNPDTWELEMTNCRCMLVPEDEYWLESPMAGHLTFDQLADKGSELLRDRQDLAIKQANEILRKHK